MSVSYSQKRALMGTVERTRSTGYPRESDTTAVDNLGLNILLYIGASNSALLCTVAVVAAGRNMSGCEVHCIQISQGRQSLFFF